MTAYQIPRPQIPNCAWKRPIGKGWSKPYTVRYDSNLDDGPWHGAPLGGFGAGCIGRSPKGDFNLWHLDGGEHIFKSIPACQFSVFESVEGGETKAYAMCCEETSPPKPLPQPLSYEERGVKQKEENSLNLPPIRGDRGGSSLSRWNWYPKEKGIYSALYPRSWYEYQGVLKSELTCEQFSPIWKENYQETSYPVAIFDWTVHNPTDKAITLSIMLTWQNTVGWFTNAIKSPEVKV
ncbi:MAG: GH116 family glycosyl-hydrolase, partial [Xenococcaceae cyanobacterium MO_207.B15]|nr:GH116 family glycosyl-hydrolase [Xenococcaceae cyanobacterium MO_207.B15]